MYRVNKISVLHFMIYVHLLSFESSQTDLFKVVCLFTWPFNESEAGVDPVMI